VQVPGEWGEVADLPLAGLGVTLDEFTARNDLQIAHEAGLYSADDQQQITTETEWALAYVANRFGHTPTQPVSVDLQYDDSCMLNGAALTEQRLVQVMACPQHPHERVVNLLAHELVHQLAHDYYGERHLQADMILLEGLATWGAGDYWLSGEPSFKAFVLRHYYQTDKMLPLQTSYTGRSIDEMNMLYYQWGSFVEYLLQTYGRDKFDALYVTGAKSPGSADYQGVYGKDFATLEREWLAWLGQE
jgi:hypothetical protein